MIYHKYLITHIDNEYMVDLGDEIVTFNTLQDAKDFIDTL